MRVPNFPFSAVYLDKEHAVSGPVLLVTVRTLRCAACRASTACFPFRGTLSFESVPTPASIICTSLIMSAAVLLSPTVLSSVYYFHVFATRSNQTAVSRVAV